MRRYKVIEVIRMFIKDGWVEQKRKSTDSSSIRQSQAR